MPARKRTRTRRARLCAGYVIRPLKVYCSCLVWLYRPWTQNKYITRHNAALKILFFEILQDLGLVDSVPPRYSPLTPKPVYEANNAQAFWDVPLFAEHQEVRANRVDAPIINHESKRVITLEMSCPWAANREIKTGGKTTKYGLLRWELKRKYQGYEVKQYNMWWTY